MPRWSGSGGKEPICSRRGEGERGLALVRQVVVEECHNGGCMAAGAACCMEECARCGLERGCVDNVDASRPTESRRRNASFRNRNSQVEAA